jgi:uncharacterized protein YjbI with pentapeptide repeats
MDVLTQNSTLDCFQVEFLAVPVQPPQENQWLLMVSLNFQQHWEDLFNGQIRFGLKGINLSLQLEQATLSETQSSTLEQLEVIPHSEQEPPFWTFTTPAKQTVLETNFSQIQLATLQPTGPNYSGEAFLAVTPADIAVTEIQGLWTPDLNPNKHSILERKIAAYLHDQLFTPYIAQVLFASEKVKRNHSQPQIQPTLTTEKLQAAIEQVLVAKTEDIVQLATAAAVNHKTDLAGGNLLGTNLSGIDLSEADLHHAYLRGADLSDADLSSANLSRVNLSGADVSGAYLSNADLSNSYLYRASLALANLSGANLRGANLQEVNLSQANLSHTLVEEAVFGDNPGMSDSLREELLAGGAILRD